MTSSSDHRKKLAFADGLRVWTQLLSEVAQVVLMLACVVNFNDTETFVKLVAMLGALFISDIGYQLKQRRSGSIR